MFLLNAASMSQWPTRVAIAGNSHVELVRISVLPDLLHNLIVSCEAIEGWDGHPYQLARHNPLPFDVTEFFSKTVLVASILTE